MLQNVRIGAKLGGAFGVLILIAVGLGGLSVYHMTGVGAEAEVLASQYVDAVEVANGVERAALLTMYDVRGWALSEDAELKKKADTHYAELLAGLDKTAALAKTADRLTGLGAAEKTAREATEGYEKAVEETARLLAAANDARGRMDVAAKGYLTPLYEYYENQKKSLEEEVAGGAPPEKIKERVEKIVIINEAIDLGNEVRIAAWRAQVSRDAGVLREVLARFPDIEKKIEEMRVRTHQQHNLDKLAASRKAAGEYSVGLASLADAFAGLTAIGKSRTEIGMKVLAAAQGESTRAIEDTDAVAHESAETLARSSTTMVVGLAIAALLGIGCAVFMTRAITKPLAKGVDFAQAVAAGDLEAQVDVTQQDEIGVLAEALRGMVAKLREIVGEIRSAADNVASGSQQLSSSSTEMSEGASEQASSVEEVSSSMEEMSANIRQNADNAHQTEAIATKSATDAGEGGQAVTATVSAMRDIAAKISIIEEIARQTNLLALNAAIEAARAGDHGKGFAVVAAEVRKLAERSQKAAGEISTLSCSSVAVAERAGQMLGKLVPDITRTADLVQEISASSREQSTGAEQIDKAIQQLDRVIQQNASAAEEMAATAEELSAQAAQLLSTVSFFRLDATARIPARGSDRTVAAAGPAARQRKVAPAPARTASVPGELLGREDDGAFERM